VETDLPISKIWEIISEFKVDLVPDDLQEPLSG
jgi:hypothetical protein